MLPDRKAVLPQGGPDGFYIFWITALTELR
jgi:hypothetical protein